MSAGGPAGGSGREITRATPDRLSSLAAMLGRAFVDEPMMLWPMGEQGDRVDRFTRAFAVVLEQVLGLGLVREAGDAHGAALWFPPAYAEPWDEHPWNDPRIGALTDDGGARYDEFWHWVESRTPHGALWLLDSLGVEPALQGRGIGTALIAAGLALARADGVGAFLTTGTKGNVSVYARSGFRVVEDLDAPGGGPHIWFMRWDP
ncbi:MAG TPA: GNAT family N-acetyltransferase [Solirubrobacteraceae bacterium]